MTKIQSPESVLSTVVVAADHPAFAGHFPGMPVFPGAALLDIVILEIERSRGLPATAWQILSAKFLEIVSPGQPLVLEHAATGNGTIRFTVRTDRATVASGQLSSALETT